MSHNTTNKVVLVGSGAVGTSFLYSSISQGIAEEYGIIDINQDLALGNKLDLEDAIAGVNSPSEIHVGGYELVSDADVLVITAGRPQKEGETRLQMVGDNAKIIASIAKQVKDNGFKGITIIASNPVDIMTTVYQEVTGFEPSKVISSGCSLDTLRLKIELSKIMKIAPKEFGMFVLGEHGDSSVSTFTHGTIRGIPINDEYVKFGLTEDKLQELHKVVFKKAYEIINRKRATFYGIGSALAEITKTILRDEKKVLSVGKYLTGEYGQSGVYASVPCILGKEGIINSFEFPLSEQELQQFSTSVETLLETKEKAFEALKK